MQYNEDTVVVLHWMDRVQQAVILDDALYHYRMRKSSLMHGNSKQERAIVNLQAFDDLSNYARSRQLLHKYEIDKYDAEAYLYVALQFVRQCFSSEQRKKVATKTSVLLQGITPIDNRFIKPRVYRRIELLRKHPCLFAWKMFLTGFFSFHARMQNKKLSSLFP